MTYQTRSVNPKVVPSTARMLAEETDVAVHPVAWNASTAQHTPTAMPPTTGAVHDRRSAVLPIATTRYTAAA
jgi:hypothetical protein